MKVGQYEVLGNVEKEMSVPAGTIETFGSWSPACAFTNISGRRSSRPGRVAFCERQPSTSYWATFIESLRDISSGRISLPLMLAQSCGRGAALTMCNAIRPIRDD
jgi:hypothetical protein